VYWLLEPIKTCVDLDVLFVFLLLCLEREELSKDFTFLWCNCLLFIWYSGCVFVVLFFSFKIFYFILKIANWWRWNVFKFTKLTGFMGGRWAARPTHGLSVCGSVAAGCSTIQAEPTTVWESSGCCGIVRSILSDARFCNFWCKISPLLFASSWWECKSFVFWYRKCRTVRIHICIQYLVVYFFILF
jgi:hypothetical protein